MAAETRWSRNRWLVVAVAFAAAAFGPGLNYQRAMGATTPLPQAAQNAIKKGKIAAGQHDYHLAASYFQTALNAAPNDTTLYYFLGLADAKIPGRESRAIHWLEAYLATKPNIPQQTRAAIQHEVSALRAANASTAGTPLPQAAMDAITKGKLAFQQGGYRLAIRYLQKAIKAAPDDTMIYYDLGMAESKIPGRELRAICWYEAYLATNPNTPAQAAIRHEIALLNIADRIEISRVWHLAVNAAIALPTAGRENIFALEKIAIAQAKAGQRQEARSTFHTALKASGNAAARRGVAEAEAQAGYFQSAMLNADRITGIYDRGEAWVSILTSQAEAGHFQAALKAAETVPLDQYEHPRGRSLANIAGAMANAGHLKSALKIARMIADRGAMVRGLDSVAKAAAKAGKSASARAVFSNAIKIAGSNGSNADGQMVSALVLIAKAQARAGFAKDASSTLSHAHRVAEGITDAFTKFDALLSIARAQAATGHHRAAGLIFRQAISADQRVPRVYQMRFVLCSDLGEAGFAHMAIEQLSRRNAGNSQLLLNRDFVLCKIALRQAREGDSAGALATVAMCGKADEPSYEAQVLCAIARRQAKAGQGRAAAATLSHAAEDVRRITDSPDSEATRDRVVMDRVVAKTQRKIAVILRGVAYEMSMAGNFAAATRTVQYIPDANVRSGTLDHIAEAEVSAQISVGNFSSARVSAEAITKNTARQNTLDCITIAQAKAYAKAGRITSALQATRKITGAGDRAGTLACIGLAESKSGKMAGARRTFAAAIRLAEQATGAHGTPPWQAIIRDMSSSRCFSGAQVGATRARLAAAAPRSRLLEALVCVEIGERLNGAIFRNPIGYLKTISQYDNLQKLFNALYKAADTMVKERNRINKIIKTDGLN